MGRKKKKEDIRAAIEPYEFNPDELIETTMLDDTFKRYTIMRPPTFTVTSSDGVVYPSSIPSGTWGSTTINAHEYSAAYGWDSIKRKVEREEIGDVNVINKPAGKGEHIVACEDKNDLSIDRILKTLSAVKAKLMSDIAPIHIKTIECTLTPEVRKNIITASKRLKMYGKKMPIIARFDEYGNRLPDEIELDTTCGITLKIVDPDDYGPLYLEMRAIELPNEPDMWSQMSAEDLPF